MERATLVDETCSVRSNEQVGPNLFLIEIEAPRIASVLLPGQFVHVKVPGMESHLLRRPFSVYRTDASSNVLSILYQVVGFGTDVLSHLLPATSLCASGPIGSHWELPDGSASPLLVGGGVGAAPLYLFAQELSNSGVGATVVIGAQTKEALVTLGAYEDLPGISVVAATDDGTFGYAGFCTEPARTFVEDGADFVACCGPEMLMRIVAEMAARAGVPCAVSMERRMACGVGACLSCVVDTADGKKRCCIDGPIFDAREVVWQ
ncbi:MAG: dihydroorotate dehydrogenase electron transfer subunit [Eggerthellaceae bacterium]|nr:dihydroorotate dehydrogenase electron transfer subunit [Eggerthellaceae bacterium]